MFENLTESNFQIFAMKNYTNPNCTDVLEFHDDLKRIGYLKRLFRKYKETGELKDRLIINHIMVLYNTFEPRALTRMLILKLSDHLDCLKPFLMALNYWTTNIGKVDGKYIIDSDISLDNTVVKVIRQTINEQGS
jgi:hypothetical protein